jgi:hypothetical protein
LVLSIENHCSPQQQEEMAKIFCGTFGDMLAPLFGSAPLPSPAALVGKILIKGKVLAPVTPIVSEPAPPPAATAAAKKEKKKKSKEPEPTVAKALSDITHLGTFSFPHGPITATTVLSGGRPPCMMFSVSETKLIKVVKGTASGQTTAATTPPPEQQATSASVKQEALSAIQRYNSTHFSRVYPKGTRVNSSNYDPALGWACGCQLVALNYQTSSMPMWVNEAKFLMNGGVGYVLKPEWMLRGEEPPAAAQRRLRVKVISASQLPSTERDIIDSYVVLTLAGYHTDHAERRTKTVMDNGWNPRFDEEFEFAMRAPEMAVLSVVVWDRDVGKDDCVCRYSFPIAAVRPGYRALPMYDANTSALIPNAHVLCHFSSLN